MGFSGVYTAIYDYQPQGDNELEIATGELLYVLEKGADDWWKVKKKAADEDDEEPVGLVPANYVEATEPSSKAKALFDYSRQTDEEISFAEDAILSVFDTSDPDWTLVGFNEEYGFAPANYIELQDAVTPKSPSSPESRPLPPRPAAIDEPGPESPPAASPQVSTPAAALAKVLGGGASNSKASSTAVKPSRRQLTPEPSDDEEIAPALPQRPPSQSFSPPPTQYASPQTEEPPGVISSPPHNRVTFREASEEKPAASAPGGYHLYNINEMVSAMGKRKKMPATLGLNIATGIIMFSPEKSRDGASQQWTADRMTHYSIEGKHVFLELIRPSKSLDLHAGTKDTAEEIVATLGEIGGAVRAEGIREVLAAASGGAGTKKGHILYDFMAQGDDEVTVAAGDDVIVLDDTKSDEWWMVRRLKDGSEGVVPSSYVEITDTMPAEPPSRSGLNAGRSHVEQNRLEEERLAKEAAKKKSPEPDFSDEPPFIRGVAVKSSVNAPDRGSSLSRDDASRRERRSKSIDGKSKPKPEISKCRVWTDRSGTFKVEAQFIGLSDGKIHLHKVNGVKIAVPVAKMAPEDLAYVEKATGVSLDEDKPLGDLKRKKRSDGGKTKAGATIEPSKQRQYDWFDFFLKAGVGPHQCERYAQNMHRDSMDESNLPDISNAVLRTLGLKEGDILRVMKYLDTMHGRSNRSSNPDGQSPVSAGGLFSTAEGGLRNNTRKGRPETNRVASDVVDAKAFEQQSDDVKTPPADSKPTPLTSAPAREKQNGFDDNAWEVKSSAQSTSATKPDSTKPLPSGPSQPALTGAMADLALLSAPLQPTILTPQPPAQSSQSQPISQQSAPAVTMSISPAPQPTLSGADASFFGQLNPQQTGLPPSQIANSQQPFPYQNSIPQQAAPRQRPQAPQQAFNPGSLLPPPPRPLSAPQNVPQQSQFGPPPLQPQLTGLPQSSILQAPPGQSLNELNQQRLYAQHTQQLAPQMTGYQQPGPGLPPFQQAMNSQQTGFQPQMQHFAAQQPHMNGNSSGSPFADPRQQFQPQPTGFGQFNQQQQGTPAGGINSILPPALQPQQTGFQSQPQLQPQLAPQQTGYIQPQQTAFQANGFSGPSSAFQAPPVPPIPQQHQAPAPLQPQKTGPAPPVRFGVAEAKKLAPQPTGKRANLAHATAQNPFGF